MRARGVGEKYSVGAGCFYPIPNIMPPHDGHFPHQAQILFRLMCISTKIAMRPPTHYPPHPQSLFAYPISSIVFLRPLQSTIVVPGRRSLSYNTPPSISSSAPYLWVCPPPPPLEEVQEVQMFRLRPEFNPFSQISNPKVPDFFHLQKSSVFS